MGGYYPGASDMQPQRLVGEHRRPAVKPALADSFADYLEALNLSGSASIASNSRPLRAPTGRATHVIITEYDLPRKEIQPHDVIVDRDGGVWFSHFGEQFLSKLDPENRQGHGLPDPGAKARPPEGNARPRNRPDGHIWVGMMYQGGMAQFDRKTEQFRIYPIPKEWQTDATQQSHFSVAGMKVDGKAWVKNSDRSQVMRLDLETGQYENLGTFQNPSNGRPIGIYGIYADQQNNAYILEFRQRRHRQDRRQDRQDGVLSDADAVMRGRGAAASIMRTGCGSPNTARTASACSIPKTEKITEWKKPLAWEAPYDVVADRNGEVWEVNTFSDRSAGSIRRPANGSIIRCRATRTSAARSSTTARAR